MRKVEGVGICDRGKYKGIQNGKQTKVYTTWHSMIVRSYSKKTHKRLNTYKNCSVVDEWLYFQTFAEWFYKNYLDGYELDKDILIKGNKVYGPDTCCFVPKQINYLFVKSNKIRGKYPIGVHYCKYRNKYFGRVSIDGFTKGKRFDTIEESFNWYKERKEAEIKRKANKYKDTITPECYNALINYVVEITD